MIGAKFPSSSTEMKKKYVEISRIVLKAGLFGISRIQYTTQVNKTPQTLIGEKALLAHVDDRDFRTGKYTFQNADFIHINSNRVSDI